MRSIIDKRESAEKSKKNAVVIGLVLTLILLISSLGYSFLSSEDSGSTAKTQEFNGVEFQQSGYGTWLFSISGNSFETRYNPVDTENISVIITKTLQNYNGNPIYFGINSKEDISTSGNTEIMRNLQRIVARSNFACLSDSCEENYPVKSCASDNIIIFEKEQETSGFSRIRDEEGCVRIYTSEEDAERAADAFLFKILGL